MDTWRDIADLVVRAALDAANAGNAVRRAWKPIDDGPLLILSIGKASVEMAAAVSDLLAGRLFEGIVTAVPERVSAAPGKNWRVSCATTRSRRSATSTPRPSSNLVRVTSRIVTRDAANSSF